MSHRRRHFNGVCYKSNQSYWTYRPSGEALLEPTDHQVNSENRNPRQFKNCCVILFQTRSQPWRNFHGVYSGSTQLCQVLLATISITLRIEESKSKAILICCILRFQSQDHNHGETSILCPVTPHNRLGPYFRLAVRLIQRVCCDSPRPSRK